MTLIFSRGRINHQVGTIQTIFDNTRRRGASWRDQEEAFAQYELTEVAEMLLEFLSPRDQQTFSRQISNVLEIFKAFAPEVTEPYAGQGLVNAEGRSQLVTLLALKPSRKHFLIPRGVAGCICFFLIVKQWYLFLNNNISNPRTYFWWVVVLKDV